MSKQKVTLELIMDEINYLKRYMHEVSLQVDHLAHPLLVEVSQLLDKKLNQHQQLTSQQ